MKKYLIGLAVLFCFSVWMATGTRTCSVSRDLLMSNVEALAVGEDEYFFHCLSQTSAICVCGNDIVLNHYHR